MNQLHDACGRGDLEEVTSLLSSEECDINALNSGGESPLHIACKNGHLKIVQVLQKNHQCDLNTQNHHGNTPLHIACINKSIAIVEFLLEMKCSTGICNENGDTPLHSAVRYNKTAAIFKLLAHQLCNINAQNKVGDTPLHVAVKENMTAPVSQLLANNECNPNILNEDTETPLHIAVKYGISRYGTLVQLLSCNECDLNVRNREGDTPLHCAVRLNESIGIPELLAHQHCNPNVQNNVGDAPLHSAVRHVQSKTIDLLVSCKKCDLNIQNNDADTPLHIAVKDNKNVQATHIAVHTISQLLSCEECDVNNCNKEGDTPLHIAVRNNIPPAISQLLTEQHCNPNVQNKSGDLPLHIAVRQKNAAAISGLLAHQQCRVNVQNDVGDTPLHIAVRDSKMAPVSQLHIGVQQSISQLLACEECDLNIHNKEGDTPLHIAVRENITPVISQLLTKQQCNSIVQNKEGDLPLHIAARQNKTAAISQLLAHQQCSINVQNKEGDTALHISVKESKMTSVSQLHIVQQSVSQLLSCNGCDLNIHNKEGDTPLHIAVREHIKPVIFQLLANRECNVNVQNEEGHTPLHVACYQKSLDIIRFLIDKRCCTNIPSKEGETAQDIPLDEDGDCLLHIACQWGDEDIVRYLIHDQKCEVNIQSAYLNTPLHNACYQKELSTARILLEQKCSTNIPNMKGETAQDIPVNEDGDVLLHIACQWGDVKITQYLICDEKCNLNVRSSTTANTPLHIAVKYGQIDTLVQMLSYKDCDLNAQNRQGDTPLHIACCRKLLGTINLFLEKRCSTNISNKKGETAQNFPLNEDGDCLLHIACQWGDVDIVRYLINLEGCNPSVQSYTSRNTPLHIAARYGRGETIVQLLSYKECNINVQNRIGDTPLHSAIWHGQEGTLVQLLSYDECDPNVKNNRGNIPLHTAIARNNTTAISGLLAHQQCNINVQNKVGDTPLHTAVWNVLHGQKNTIVKLLSCKNCDPNIQNKEGDTPLHIAVKDNLRISAISELLTSRQCNPNVVNNEGSTPLHIAVKYGQEGTIIKLLSCKECDPNVQNKEGDTALHIAVRQNKASAISQLLSQHQCNTNIQNKVGDTPLHIAVRKNIVPVISNLLANRQCDPNVVNNDHMTPLLIAIQHSNSSAASALLQHKTCNPTLCDLHGNTPLHLACIGGETQTEMVAIAKHLLISVDPSCVNNAGQTPIELTTNYQLIKAISHMVQCKTKQSVQTYINMFIVGNPETGKSTLIKAICKEASILWKIVPKQMRRVKNVPPHTAGIIPTTFRSKTFGNTVLHDLAGQVEYYTSHAAVIQSTVISTPPAFIIVVNLSESKEKISQTLRYWWSFIDNHAARSNAPPQVVLVGSHADKVKSTGGSVQENMTQMSDILKKLPASFSFAGQVALDCRDPASKKLQLFCSIVNQSCTVLRETADIDLRCHVLYAFLLERFKDKVACTVSDVATSVKENSELLPQNPNHLVPLISTLSDKGLLLLVRGGKNHGEWWIILQKQALLSKINGTIFAPNNFRQHKDFSWSTGVVPFLKLKDEFSDYDPNMLCEFLINLEFCFKIEDHETLALLKDEVANVEGTSPDVSDEYYFFPALVSVKNPLHLWEVSDAMCCKCGWFYQCIQHDQFLTTQFLHVLILRLAFNFALKLDPGDSLEDSLSFCRRCSVWKHGIAWLNRIPIETVVEVGLQCQSVIVMMRCPKGKEANCAQLRLQVIQKILEAKDEHCKAVKMSEMFIHPTDVKYPFTDNIEDVKSYSLTEVVRVAVQGKANVLDRRGQNPLPVQDVLLFDPCGTDTSTNLLEELFGRKHSMDEKVKSQVLEIMKSESGY